MRTKKGFVLRDIGEEKVLIGEGLDQIDFNKIMALNESAAYIWESIEGKDFEVQDVAQLLSDIYEVDAKEAEEDSNELIKEWKSLGLIED